MDHKYNLFFLVSLIIAVITSSCQSQPAVVDTVEVTSTRSEATPQTIGTSLPTTTLVKFELQTEILEGKMVYRGVGGEIDGIVNPDLVVPPGVSVNISLVNGDSIPHNISLPDFDVLSGLVSSKGKSTEVSFEIGKDQSGFFPYFCTQAGHRQAGQEGKLIVEEP